MPDDLPYLWALANQYKDVYLNDDDAKAFNVESFCQALDDAFVLVLVDDGTQKIVGFVAANDITGSLHATVHLLVWPRLLRATLSNGSLQQAVGTIFGELGVDKLIAKPFLRSTGIGRGQRGACRLVERLGFARHGFYRKHVKKNGIKHDVMIYELSRGQFNKGLARGS